VYGCPRQGDDIKIEEVLQKNDLELAVLSAFQVDPDVRALDSYPLFCTPFTLNTLLVALYSWD
jgi:hypothetical protein